MQGQLHRISKRVLWIFEERFCIIQEWFQSMKRCTAENSPVEIPDHEKMHQRVRRIHQFEERQHQRVQRIHQLKFQSMKGRTNGCVYFTNWRAGFASSKKAAAGAGNSPVEIPSASPDAEKFDCGRQFQIMNCTKGTDLPIQGELASRMQFKAELQRKHTMGAESPNLKKFKSMKAFSTIAGTSLNSKSCSRSSQKQPEGHKWQIKRNSAQPDITSRAPKQAQRTSDN